MRKHLDKTISSSVQFKLQFKNMLEKLDAADISIS